MRSMLFATITELLQLNSVLQGFLVLVRVVVHLLAHGTFKFDQVVLGHKVG